MTTKAAVTARNFYDREYAVCRYRWEPTEDVYYVSFFQAPEQRLQWHEFESVLRDIKANMNVRTRYNDEHLVRCADVDIASDVDAEPYDWTNHEPA